MELGLYLHSGVREDDKAKLAASTRVGPTPINSRCQYATSDKLTKGSACQILSTKIDADPVLDSGNRFLESHTSA